MKKNCDNYRETVPHKGQLCVHVDEKTTGRIIRYCKVKNINKTKFIADCVNKQLDQLEREALHDMSKEMLIEMILSGSKGV